MKKITTKERPFIKKKEENSNTKIICSYFDDVKLTVTLIQSQLSAPQIPPKRPFSLFNRQLSFTRPVHIIQILKIKDRRRHSLAVYPSCVRCTSARASYGRWASAMVSCWAAQGSASAARSTSPSCSPSSCSMRTTSSSLSRTPSSSRSFLRCCSAVAVVARRPCSRVSVSRGCAGRISSVAILAILSSFPTCKYVGWKTLNFLWAQTLIFLKIIRHDGNSIILLFTDRKKNMKNSYVVW